MFSIYKQVKETILDFPQAPVSVLERIRGSALLKDQYKMIQYRNEKRKAIKFTTP